MLNIVWLLHMSSCSYLSINQSSSTKIQGKPSQMKWDVFCVNLGHEWKNKNILASRIFANCHFSDRYICSKLRCVCMCVCAWTLVIPLFMQWFLFACLDATQSSLGDAFLMIQERRDVPRGFSVASQWPSANCHLQILVPCYQFNQKDFWFFIAVKVHRTDRVLPTQCSECSLSSGTEEIQTAALPLCTNLNVFKP